jgi:cyclophilin family peptidyl-prolyl cis-trans isomerase
MEAKQMTARATILTILAAVSTCVYLGLTGCGPSESSDAGANNVPAAIAADNEPTPKTDATPAKTPQKPTVQQNAAARRAEIQKTMFPQVVFETTAGEIVVRLNREKSRRTVDNFLENYVKRSAYDGTVFHHVDDAMVIGGGFGRELEPIATRSQVYNEAHNGLKNQRGTIAMIRDPDNPHSATSQFFFNLRDNAELDYKDWENAKDFGYCVFGEVVQGLDVLDRIAKLPVAKSDPFPTMPAEKVVVQAVRQLR